MKIKARINIKHNGTRYTEGQIIEDIDAESAELLIAANSAVQVGDNEGDNESEMETAIKAAALAEAEKAAQDALKAAEQGGNQGEGQKTEPAPTAQAEDPAPTSDNPPATPEPAKKAAKGK